MPAVAIPTPAHAKTRTFFEKNTKAQIAKDVEDLDTASALDAESLSEAGYQDAAQQMDEQWRQSELREEIR